MSYFIYRGKSLKRVGFFGLGRSNLALMQYFTSHFPKTEFTLRSDTPINNALNIRRVYFGNSALADISEDALFLSPSARRDRAEILNARSRGVIISSDAELFFEHRNADIFAVTGSDGKSTTAYLTSLFLSDKERICKPIGNIGVPFATSLCDGKEISYAAELSSFQLMYMKPRSKRCLITNISENHLNWHTSFWEYINAKRNIFENSSERIINYDCEISRKIGSDYPIFAVFSSRLSENGLRSKIKADIYITRRGSEIISSEGTILDTNDIKLRGEYNIMNFMAASALSFGLASPEKIRDTAIGFRGLAHRCEYIGSYKGVRYIDSSIDSSPQRTAATLSAVDERVILILGGRSKGLDFASLANAVSEKAKYIVITGECSDEILSALLSNENFKSSNIKYAVVKPFYNAVLHASGIAEDGDTVLLSPAATSYDEFTSFEARGEKFKEIIKNI